jgi:hypothetical protein
VLRRISGPRKDKVTAEWRKLNKAELHNVCSLPHIIRMIQSRRISWARNLARMERRGMNIGYWWESQKERDQ